ncbi:hypothetical protein Tco_1079289 [Tanacetum coccineum]|uniref:Uncharacterized protein n=1 Tax=Tanacetum coccineum TaxID=301880 RepID=A0ABQ5HRM0_9ASTR
MSFGSQTVGDAVVLKFDMHIYTSVLTFDEVKSLVAEYAIPSDLHPCVPPSGLTMNRLPIDKIVATSMSQFLKFPMAGGVRVGKGTALAANKVIPQHTTPPLLFGSQIPEKSDHQKVIEYENERVFAVKRKAQAAKDRAVGKRVATEGASHRPKKKKTTPLSFALSDSEADGSNRSGYVEEDTDHNLDNVEDTTEVNSPLSEHSPHFQHSNPSDEDTHNMRNEPTHTHAFASTVSSSSGGSHCQAFPRRNPGGGGIGSFPPLLSNVRGSNSVAEWHKIDHLQQYEALIKDYGELYESHWSCQDVFDRDDLLDKKREREERIKQLEADLASKTSSLTKAEGAASTLKGDLEHLTKDLSHAEIVRHNYVHQLLPTVFQRLLFSACSEEEAEAFLATAVDYDPACKTTFMSEFDSLFNKSYPYVEKLVESFRLPLGDLHNMWPKGTWPILSGNAADV